MAYLEHLAYIAIVLLIGTLASVLAYSLKTSDILILIFTGMIFEKLGLLVFDREFIILISTLAIIFIVFNNTFKINFKELKKYFIDSLELNLIFFILSILVLVPSFIYIFNLGWRSSSLMVALLFAVLCYGTDSMMCTPKTRRKNRVIEIMEIESLINPPITSIVAFLILAAMGPSVTHHTANPSLWSFFSSIGVSLFSGLLVSFIILSILKKNYLGDLTHLSVITSAVIAYVGAEFMGGIGALAVAVYGLFFGNSHISHLIEIERFESIISNSVKILTFMLVGTFLFVLPEFIIKGTLLFIICLIVRFISVSFLARKERFKLKHILFMTLNVPKNIEVAVILLIIISLYSNVMHIQIVTNVMMLMILYSVVLASVSSHFFKSFFDNHHVKKIKRN